MTVKELIAELQKLDGDLEVQTEGCDCFGDVGSLEVNERYVSSDPKLSFGAFVLLRRCRDE